MQEKSSRINRKNHLDLTFFRGHGGAMKHEVIRITDALGTQRLCEALGVKPASIEKARVTGMFPASWYAPLRYLCDVNGIDCPLEPFAWKAPK
jgi:hypothetical protein